MRLTADGRLRTCLFGDHEVDLRDAAARRASRSSRSCAQALADKPQEHALLRADRRTARAVAGRRMTRACLAGRRVRRTAAVHRVLPLGRCDSFAEARTSPSAHPHSMVNKITVVGAGNVGATTAQRVAEKELARTRRHGGRRRGHSAGQGARPVAVARPSRASTRASSARTATRRRPDSDIVVITAGIARKPGMSRDDLLNTNAGIVKSVSRADQGDVARTRSSSSCRNPLDVMCYVAKEVTGFPRERVIGMAGVLDTARYRAFLAEALDVSVRDIQAMVLGGHGDTMVPLISYTSVSGIPITQLMDQATLDAIVDAHAQRRRRDREAPQDRLGVLRAVGRRRADGRGDRARPAAHPAVRRVARGRVRHVGPVPRRALQARTQWPREDHRGRAHRRRARGAREERARRSASRWPRSSSDPATARTPDVRRRSRFAHGA